MFHCAKGETQIPFGNDNQKERGKTQIPFGDDNQKERGRTWTPFGIDNRRSAVKVGLLLLVSLLLPSLKAEAQQALPLTGDVAFTHDPSIAKDGGTYYVFATGKAPDGGQFPIRCSTDLHAWRMCGHVFDEMPAWVRERSPGTKELWAPDISHEHGEYRLYYAYSLFGVNTSGIGLAVNKTLDTKSPEYKWVDKGLVLDSKASDNFNAIDPNYIEDGKGGAWLSFGSFWTGIKMRRLDPATGMLLASDPVLYPLASRARPNPAPIQKFDPEHPVLPPDWTAVEAPFVVRHDGYFYLFVSWDLCCRGTRSTYRTMVGRARAVTGPYVDRNGVPMTSGGGTQVLFPNAKWLGPGGASAFDDKGQDYLVFHAYDATSGRPGLQISTITWKDGWPSVVLGSQ